MAQLGNPFSSGNVGTISACKCASSMKRSSHQIGETEHIDLISARLRCGTAARWWASDFTHVLRTAHSSSVRRQVRETLGVGIQALRASLNATGPTNRAKSPVCRWHGKRCLLGTENVFFCSVPSKQRQTGDSARLVGPVAFRDALSA